MDGQVRFGDFELDLDAYELRRSGVRVRLERLPMECLILLVRRPGALVTRAEIQAALWADDVFVDFDSAVNTAIRKIRRGLADVADTPRFVETVVGKGYRFIAPVERLEAGAGAGRVRSGPGAAAYPRYRLTRGRLKFFVGPGQTLIGRDPQAGVCVDHPSVSRRHARLTLRDGRAVLEDLESRNGTFVNGRPIRIPTPLAHGAVIGLGPIALRFFVEQAPRSTRSVGPSRRPGRRVRAASAPR